METKIADTITTDMPVAFRFTVSLQAYPNNAAILLYNYAGRFVGCALSAEYSVKFLQMMFTDLPLKISYNANTLSSEFSLLQKNGMTVKDITQLDLSFEKFWHVYANKIGNLARVRKKWNELTTIDKIFALGFINKLRNYYSQKGFEYPFPETYLNQRRWENIL